MTTDPASHAEKGALIVPAPELGTLVATGPDSVSWLNGLVTSDLTKLASGTASYGLILVKVGRILSDAWFVSAGAELMIGVPRDRTTQLREHFEKYLMMEDAAHRDASGEWAWAHVHGPRAAELVREVPAAHGGFGGVFDVTGLGGGVIVAPPAAMSELLADMTRRGPEIVIGSASDWDAVRVRRGLPRFGIDFGDKNYPQEASLEKVAVSFQKGCYLGQEVVCRLEMRGHVIKKIVGIRLDGEPPAQGAEVHSSDGKPVGTVSSATRVDGESLALAMVRVDFTEPGTELSIEGRKASVVPGR